VEPGHWSQLAPVVTWAGFRVVTGGLAGAVGAVWAVDDPDDDDPGADVDGVVVAAGVGVVAWPGNDLLT
jgi:hypothetical protein